MLHRLVLFLLRSIFLYGYTWARRGSNLLLILHTGLATYIISSSPVLSLVLLAPMLLLYILSGMPRLLVYGVLLASIPSTWLSLTQLILDIAMARGLTSTSLMVFIRYELLSLHALLLLHYANLDEASYLLYKLTRKCSIAVFPLLVWRSMAQLLREASEALLAHRLKGVKVWQTLAISLLRADEVAKLIHEAHVHKTRYCRPNPMYSRGALLFQVLMILLDLVIIAFLGQG